MLSFLRSGLRILYFKKIRSVISALLAAVMITGQPLSLYAEGRSSLQVQSLFNPIEYKELLPLKVLEYYLQCIGRSGDIASLDVCLNPSIRNDEGGQSKMIIDLRKETMRKEGTDTVAFCSVNGSAYEAVIGPDNGISIRKPVSRDDALSEAVQLSGRSSASGDIEYVHSASMKFLNAEHGGSTWSRVAARSEMVGGLTMNWRSRPQPASFSEGVKLLISRLVRMRISWRVSEGFDYNERELTDEIVDSGPMFAVNEILKNAFDACAKTGKDRPIMFTVVKDNVKNRFVIEVSDGGIGVKHVLNEPGTIVVSSRLPKPGTRYEIEGGRGMGLMWSKAIVEMHGGSIDVFKSKRQGYRTTVRITLPAESLNIEKIPVEKTAEERNPIDENSCSSVTKLAIRSSMESESSAFFGTHGGERLLVIRNDGANTREGSVIIPADAVPRLWPELEPAFQSAGRSSKDDYGNFMVNDIDGRTIKFISGANCRNDDGNIALYFKLGPGESHVISLKSTRTGISRERPWNIPGIDLHGLLPDQRSFSVEESLFVESIDKNTEGKVKALIVRTEDGARYLVVHDSGHEIKERTLRVRVHIPIELVSDLRADIERGVYSFVDPFLRASLAVRLGEKRGNASILNGTLLLPIQLKPGQIRHYLLAPESAGTPLSAAPESAGKDSAAAASREESPSLVSELEFLEKDGPATTMRDIRKEDGLAKCFIEKLISSAISSERLMLLFDKDLAKAAGVDPLRVLDAIEKLRLRYPVFLKNLEVVVAASDELEKKIAENRDDWKSCQIFLFGRAAERRRYDELQYAFSVHTYLIDDARFTPETAAYYPILEVVTIALERYLAGEEEVAESMRLLGIKYEDLNIESIASDPDKSRLYIVTLLPRSVKRDAAELRKRYIGLMRLVESA